MLHNKLIKKDDIDIIFQNLANEYDKDNNAKPVNIYLVGGAAIVLNFEYRMSTIDIDAFYEDNTILSSSIQTVSQKMNLPIDWLNHDFVNTPSFSIAITKKAILLEQYGKHIHVYTLEPKYLIAMKLKSSRPTGGDMDDIIKMIYEMRYKNIPISYNDIIEAYKELYPDFSNTYQSFLDKAKEAFEVPVEDFEYLFKPY